jgi:hypothetical protein
MGLILGHGMEIKQGSQACSVRVVIGILMNNKVGNWKNG